MKVRPLRSGVVTGRAVYPAVERVESVARPFLLFRLAAALNSGAMRLSKELCRGPAAGMNPGGNLLSDGLEKRRAGSNAGNNKCSKTPGARSKTLGACCGSASLQL